MGAAFGGSSQSVFGGAGAGNFLTRLTAICAMLFLLVSGILARLSSESSRALDVAEKKVKTEKVTKAKPVAGSAASQGKSAATKK